MEENHHLCVGQMFHNQAQLHCDGDDGGKFTPVGRSLLLLYV
jgi:hypothetical protein